MQKLILLLVLVILGNLESQTISPPSGRTDKYKLRLYGNRANPGADSLNQNWKDIDKAVSDKPDSTMIEYLDLDTTKIDIVNDKLTIPAGAITKEDVGLGNVDNTSDANKPVPNAVLDSLNTRSRITHNHSLLYEPIISKSTGYMKWTGSVWEFVNKTFEDTTHKKSSWSATTTNTNYPSEKLVKDNLDLKQSIFSGICETTPITANDISINYTTRVLTINPPLGYFHYYTDGSGVSVKHTITGSISFPAFTNTSGIWYFYFNGSTAVTSQTSWWTVSETSCSVYRLLWNSAKAVDAEKSIEEHFEAHLNTQHNLSHAWQHKYGSVWMSGLDITSNAIASGTPNADGSNSVIALSSGASQDDNLYYRVTNTSTPTLKTDQNLGNTTALSLNATNSALLNARAKTSSGNDNIPATRFPFLWNSSTNIPEYIDGSGVRQPIASTDFFVTFAYSIQDLRVGNIIRLVPSYNQFANITNARAVTWETVTANDPSLLETEIRPLYRFIFEYRNSYPAGCKYTALREVADIRKNVVSQNTSATGSYSASSITVTPAGNIASTNAQSALEELDLEKQTALVSGTNIKTINSTSLLGSGDITVQPILSGSGFVKASGSTISYDNSTYALDNTVVKTTTNQSIAGVKTFSDGLTSSKELVFNTDVTSATAGVKLRRINASLFAMSPNTDANTAFGVLNGNLETIAEFAGNKNVRLFNALQVDGNLTVNGTGSNYFYGRTIAEVNKAGDFALVGYNANATGSGLRVYANGDYIAEFGKISGSDPAMIIYGADKKVQMYANLQVGGTIYGNMEAVNALAYRSTTQAVATATDATVVFDTENADTHNGYNPSTGVYTVPTGKGGTYHVEANITWNSTAWTTSNVLEMKIVHNSTTYSVFYKKIEANHTSYYRMYGSKILPNVQPGDTIQITVRQDTGGSVNIYNGVTWTNFTISRC